MPVITLPDGSQRRFDAPVTVAEVAASIGPGLAKAALAGRVDGALVDTSHRIERDATLAIVTDKDPAALEIIRHSTAHLLAQAVQSIYPTAQVTIGPVIEDGFFYDFAFERPFTPEDLAKFEARMKELAKADLPVTRRVMPRDEAIALFKGMGEHYKAEIISSIPAGEDISLYGQGDWLDLCRGPHVPSTGKLKAFKLTKLAGAYWRGDSKNADAPARLRHRLAQRAGAQGLPDAARGGREARPPAHRPRARPVPPAGGGGRQRVLAPGRLDAVARDRALHAHPARGGGLPRGQEPAAPGPRRCGRSPATGRTTATSCSSPSPRTACSRSSR